MAKAPMSPEAKHNYMLNTPMPRLLLAMALPTIAGMIVSSLYSLADTYFVSTLGTYATGAIGINASIDNIIMMVGSFLAAGSSSFISRLLGAKRTELANKVLSTSFFTAVGCGVLVLAFGLLFAEPLVRLLGATDALVPYALDYATYIFLAAPLMAGTFVLGNSLRSEGSSTLSMIGTMSGAVINVILDPIFIFTFDLGVAGASMATAISKVVSFIILIAPYIRRRTMLRISIRHISFSREIVPEVSRMGSPSLLRTALNTISAIALNNIAASYSESALAAISVCNRLMLMPFAICLGFCQGFLPVSGYSVGAKRYDRTRQALRTAMLMIFCISGSIAVLFIVFSRQFIGLFTETDAEMLRLGQFCLWIQSIALPLHAGVAVVNFLSSSRGKALPAAILGTSRQGICFFPLLPIMVWLWGEWGLASLQAAADVLSVALAVPILIWNLRDLKRIELAELAEAEAAATVDALPSEAEPSEPQL